MSTYSGFEDVTSWISFDTSSTLITMSPPTVSKDSTFKFYINSDISGNSNSARNIMVVDVKVWLSQNWQCWSSYDSPTWTKCNSSFTLNAGTWTNSNTSVNTPTTAKVSENAKAASLTTQSIIGLVSALVTLGSMMNTSSMACLWSLVNQAQSFFLLLLYNLKLDALSILYY